MSPASQPVCCRWCMTGGAEQNQSRPGSHIPSCPASRWSRHDVTLLTCRADKPPALPPLHIARGAQRDRRTIVVCVFAVRARASLS